MFVLCGMNDFSWGPSNLAIMGVIKNQYYKSGFNKKEILGGGSLYLVITFDYIQSSKYFINSPSFEFPQERTSPVSPLHIKRRKKVPLRHLLPKKKLSVRIKSFFFLRAVFILETWNC